MSDVSPVAAAQFRAGSVLGRGFTVLRGNLPAFLLLAMLPMLPTLLDYRDVLEHRQAAGRAMELVQSLVYNIVLPTFAQAIVLYGAFQVMRGKNFLLWESARLGLSRAQSVINLALLMGIAVGVGLILLVVPGLYLSAMLCVALPACVVEGRGAVDSMNRSGALTKGHRWKLVGIVLVLLLGDIIGAVAISDGIGAFAGTAVTALGLLLWNSLYVAYEAIVGVIIYHDLRVAREGIDIDRIASIFD